MSGILQKIAVALLLSVVAPVTLAAGVCSSSVGKVTLNEYNYISNFTEIDKLDSSVDLTGWTVNVYTAHRSTAASISSSTSCGQYQVNSFNANQVDPNADIVLLDKSGDVVDILRTRTSLPVSMTFYGTPPSCSFKGSSIDLLVSSGSKGVDRMPDGTGSWRQTPGTGNNSLESQCASNIGDLSSASALDAVEVGAAAKTAIRTKISGQNFTLDIIALDSGNVATSYAKTLTVELVDGSSGGGACGSMNQLQSVGSYTFTGSGTGKDNGRKTFTFNYSNAWKNVRVRMKDNSSTPVTACSTDNFAIRPASLGVSVTDTNWTTAGTTRTLNGTATTSAVTHKAGQPFTIKVTAYDATAAATSNYGGSPTYTISACSGTGNACTSSFGTLTLGSWSASGGAVTTTATYNQVGAFGLQFQDTTFADIDAADSSTTERYVPASTKLDVGRFVPDHFAVSLNTPKFASACSTGFTYQGQTFSYDTTPIISVTAQDANNSTTSLYTGSLLRLTSSTVSAAYSAMTGTLSATSATATVADGGNGVGTLTFSTPASLSFTRATSSPQSPFAAEIQLAATVSDADGVTYASNPATFGAASSGNGIAFNPGKTMRFGRIKLTNAHGSELATLSVPVEAQYWTGSYWATNTLDSCTGFAASNVNISPAITSLSAASTMTAGKGNLVLAHPSASGTTSLCIDVGPNSAETGAVNCVATTSLGKAFLQGNTNGTLYDDDPRATITFGVYKNANELIYMRENY